MKPEMFLSIILAAFLLSSCEAPYYSGGDYYGGGTVRYRRPPPPPPPPVYRGPMSRHCYPPRRARQRHYGSRLPNFGTMATQIIMGAIHQQMSGVRPPMMRPPRMGPPMRPPQGYGPPPRHVVRRHR